MDRDAIRGVSRQVCGNSYALEVISAIAEHPKERFTQAEIAATTGIGVGKVRLVCQRLLRGKLIDEHQKEGLERPLSRVKPDAELWSAITRIMRDLEQT